MPSTFFSDLRFAMRSFRRTPGFTLVAVATLALGIGAATSVFSVADAVLLRPLPFPHADRLVNVWVTEPTHDEWREVVSGATYLDWARDAHSFKEMAAFRHVDFNVTGGDLPERVKGASITPGFFSVLGVSAALGRLPVAADGASAASTVVLSDELWRSRFGSDPSVVGRTLMLNGRPHTVAGVLPPGIAYPEGTLVYVPSPYRVPMTPVNDQDMSSERGAGYLSVVGRLADGVSIATAQAEMNTIADQMARAFPATKADEGASVVSLKEDLVGNTKPMFVLLLGAVGLLLLIACANVANLLTVRASRRRRELAVRVSLGASFGRLRRQLLTESIVLALLGGIPGFLLSAWGTHVLVRLAPPNIPRLAGAAVDPQVLLFAVVATVITGLIFGLAPMVGLAEHAAASILRAAGRPRRVRSEFLRDGVIVLEVALSLLLVVGAGLMIRTFRALDEVDPGFDSSHVLVAHVNLPAEKYADSDAQAAFYQHALDRIRTLPDVESAATVLTLPMHWTIRGTFGFSVKGVPADPEVRRAVGYQVASPDYFRTLRIPLLRGRPIEASDRQGSPGVVVINEAMARRFWPHSDPLGARITFWGDPDDPATEWATVVGVVGNTAIDGLDHPAEPEAYVPVAQAAMNASTFVVRTRGDPHALTREVRQAVAEVDPTLPLYGVLSMKDVLSASLDQRRFRMLLLGVFAGAALLLGAIGLYGVISFTVSQHTRDIGIRMALGAARESVVGQVVRYGLLRVSLGIVIGALASLPLRRVIASQVFGVRATDPATYVGAAFLLAAVALLACTVPAMRAARVDPAITLRQE